MSRNLHLSEPAASRLTNLVLYVAGGLMAISAFQIAVPTGTVQIRSGAVLLKFTSPEYSLMGAALLAFAVLNTPMNPKTRYAGAFAMSVAMFVFSVLWNHFRDQTF